MKQIFSLKKSLIVVCLAGASFAQAQIHPLAFGSFMLGTTATNDNWYKDYVGLRFEVNSPASVAGDKQYTAANDGSGSTSVWGGLVTTPIVDVPIVMPQAGDSLAGTAITVDMTGKIALVYRGGGINFSDKANAAQAQNAIACVIVNNIGGGPVGMSAATTGTIIPVFMISKADGDAIDALYNLGIVAHFTITPWGLALANDLGFVPGGAAIWHSYAVPGNQLVGSGNPSPYKMVDGAFIANYGTADASGVKLNSTLSFTPTSGPATVQHKDSVSLATFTVADSIYAMFSPAEYDLTASGTGRFDLNYTISSAVADDYSGDNSLTTSFYVTDSLFSKSRYDFTANRPISTLYEAFGTNAEFMWGPMYYVAHAGTAVSRIQYSLAANAVGPFANVSNDVLIYKWVDGANGQPMDSVVQDGELDIVSITTKNFDPAVDTNNSALNLSNLYDPTGANPAVIRLDANSWYYVAVDVPAGMFLGCDGIEDPYPRIFGRFHATNSILDYSNIVSTTRDDIAANPTDANSPSPVPSVAFINSIDSFNYDNAKGLIPSVAMIMNNNPPPVAVNTVPGKPLADVTLFPIPAKDYLNVKLSLDQPAKTVAYSIVDGLGRFVSKETHYNVQNDNFSIQTSKLAAGHYLLVIDANGKAMAKKFVVIK